MVAGFVPSRAANAELPAIRRVFQAIEIAVAVSKIVMFEPFVAFANFSPTRPSGRDRVGRTSARQARDLEYGMTKDDIRRQQEKLDRSQTNAVRLYVFVCVLATAVWIKVLVQAFSMIGGK